MHTIASCKVNPIGVLEDNVPTSLFAVRRNVAFVYVLENTLVEVANIIVI